MRSNVIWGYDYYSTEDTLSLLRAARKGDTKKVKSFIYRNTSANYEARDSEGNSIYDLACKNDHTELKQYIQSQPMLATLLKLSRYDFLTSFEKNDVAKTPKTYADFEKVVYGFNRDKITELIDRPFEFGTVLLHGPEGSGKNIALSTIAEIIGATIVVHPSLELFNSQQNSAAINIDTLFKTIKNRAAQGEKIILCIDDIDLITAKSGSGEDQMLNALLYNIKLIKRENFKFGRHILFAGTTQKYDSLDASFIALMATVIKTSLPDRCLREELFNSFF